MNPGRAITRDDHRGRITMFGLDNGLRRRTFGRRPCSTSGMPKRRDRRYRPVVGCEPLERRIALSHATIQIGAVQPGLDRAFAGSMARHSTTDYQFQVNSQMIVGASLSGLSSNAELLLLNVNHSPLATFSNGRANDSFTYTFSPGVYYAACVRSEPA